MNMKVFLFNSQNFVMGSLLFLSSFALADMEWSEKRIDQAKKLFDKYSVEFNRMSSDKVDATAEGTSKLDPNNWGAVFFGKKECVEFPRAFQATLLFQDCANDNLEEGYASFTEGQSSAIKITPSEFHSVCQKIQELKNHVSLDAIEDMIVMNDLTKFHDVQNIIEEITGKTFADHDDSLLELLEVSETNNKAASLIPNFMKLDKKDRDFIRSVWKARLNIAQFVQGECQEVALEKFAALKPEQKLAGFLEVFCDVAGSGAHSGSKCIMNKFVFTPYILAYEALIQSNDMHDIYSGYYAQRRAIAEVKLPESMDKKEQLALTKMFCMRRGAKSDQFEQLVKAFNKLDEKVKKALIHELTLRPHEGTSITLMYAPALMLKAKNEDELVVAMELLAKYFEYVRKEILPVQYTFNINPAAKDTVVLSSLLNHPVYVEKKGLGADLLLQEPDKKNESTAARVLGWSVNKLNYLKKKV